MVGLEVGADDLHVDRRGKAEIENLRHDVGGQERKGRPRKGSRQRLAHLLNVAVRLALVILIDGNQDIGISRTDRAGVIVSRIDPAHGQADIVDDRTQRFAGE